MHCLYTSDSTFLPAGRVVYCVVIPQYLLQLIEDLHNGSTSSVRIGPTLSPSFLTTSGVRQGCVLAPALFCRAIDWIMERVASRTGLLSLGNDHFTDLDYADDVVLFAHKMDDLHGALEVFETTASQLGLHISWQKTKIQNLGAGDSTPCPPVCGHSLEECCSRLWACCSGSCVC